MKPIMKWYLSGIILLGLVIIGCTISPSEGNTETKDKIHAVTTIGMITDIVKNIGGEHVTVQGLMGPGVDPHLYQASEGDVSKLSNADIIFYNGLHLEAQMVEIFEKMKRTKMTVAVTEHVPREILLDFAAFPGQYDPHVWFDVTLWIQAAERVRDALVEYDPEHRDTYSTNAVAYIQKLNDLHAYVKQRAEELLEQQRILVTAHDAFSYFGRQYGFTVKGLQGISTESEAGTRDVQNLAQFIVDQKIKSIFVESSVPERNIKAVKEAVQAKGWDVRIGGQLFSDAMGDEGTEKGTYIGMVRHNIDTIVDALK